LFLELLQDTVQRLIKKLLLSRKGQWFPQKNLEVLEKLNKIVAKTQVLNKSVYNHLPKNAERISLDYILSMNWVQFEKKSYLGQAFFPPFQGNQRKFFFPKNWVMTKYPWVMGKFSWVMEKILRFLENLLQKRYFWEALSIFFSENLSFGKTILSYC